MKKEKRRLQIDLFIFVLSIVVVVFSKLEDRYFKILLLIPTVIFINFMISLYQYYKKRKTIKI